MRPHTIPALIALVVTLAGCQNQVEPAYPQGQYPPGQLPPQGYAPGQPQGYMAPGQLPPQGYGPQGMPPQGYGPQGTPQGYGPPQGYGVPPQADPINTVDVEYLRGTARSVLAELVAALPPAAQAKVQGIPLETDSKVGEVNAYAKCNRERMPSMAVTDGLLQIEAYISQLRATDEIFRTQKLDGYLQMMAKYQKPGQPIVTPPEGFVDPAQHVDPRKVARQHQLMEEQLAFVLGHELGHHHLGHTGCANGQSGDRPITVADLLRMGSKIVPVTNQPNEMAADFIGVDDLLAAGARRQGYHWTEGGALLTLHFFSSLQKIKSESLVMTIFHSHPNPAHRVEPVRQEAARFRATGQWYQPLLALP